MLMVLWFLRTFAQSRIRPALSTQTPFPRPLSPPGSLKYWYIWPPTVYRLTHHQSRNDIAQYKLTRSGLPSPKWERDLVPMSNRPYPA